MTHADHGQLIRARYGHRFDVVRIVARPLYPSISLSLNPNPTRSIGSLAPKQENMGRDLDAVIMSEEQSRVHSLCEETTQCAKALGQERKKHKHELPTDATSSLSSSRAIVVILVSLIVGLDRGASCLAAEAPDKTLHCSCYTWR